jgi:hypothetical protein
MTKSSTERQSRAAAGERVRQALSRPQWRMVEQLRKKHGPETLPASLADWHRLGVDVDGVMKSSLKSVVGAAAGLAELIGCQQWEVQRSRQFAAAYSESEAKSLQGKISWSQAVHLLTIPDEKERRAIQRECIHGHWSFVRLKNEIRIRFGRRLPLGQVGRPARRPANTRDALVELLSRMTAVVRMYRGLDGGVIASKSPRDTQAIRAVDISQLPPRLHERIEKAVHELETLCNRLEGVVEAGIDESETRRRGPPKKGEPRRVLKRRPTARPPA